MHAEHLAPGDFGDKESYFVQAINSHGRDGFLWQKLRNPRTYDYKTTHNKNFNERLRMPRFPFDYIVPNMFSGSILNLEPDTEYECRFAL